MSSTFVYVSSAADGDICAYTLNREVGKLVAGARVPAGPLVMPLAASPDGRFLYAATRALPYRLYNYRIRPDSGELQLNGVTALPESMVNITVDLTGEWLLAASYGSDSLSVYRIDHGGRTAPEASHFAKSGASKPHAIHVDPSNVQVYVPHLGSDEIHTYRFDPLLGHLTPLPPDRLTVRAGTGPRHLVRSRDSQYLYVLSELLGTVEVFSRDTSSGQFIHLQTAQSLPDDSPLLPGAPRAPSGTTETAAFDLSQAIFCADIQITPDGRFLYTSERTRSTLSCFAIDQATGTLRLIDHLTTETHPRSFAIDPSGQFLIVAGQHSPTISLYSLDNSTGALIVVDRADVGRDANWVTAVTV